MGKKRKWLESHATDTEYDLPTLKSGRRARTTAFKPNENDFCELLNEAFKSKLSLLIQAHLRQFSEGDCHELMTIEQNRRKVPPGTFETLDDQYGAYWSANTCKRLKLNALSLYKSFVQKNLDDLVYMTRENRKIQSEAGGTSALTQEEQIRSLIVPLSHVIRKDLPSSMKAVIIEKLKSAIVQYSDFSCVFSFMVYMTIINFAIPYKDTTVDLDRIIPIEFQTDSKPTSLPAPHTSPASSDSRYINDYKNLFSFTHLQIISTLNFGITGVQSQTLNNHPFWGEIQNRINPKPLPDQVENTVLHQTDGAHIDQQLQRFMDIAKSVNTTIKKSVINQLSTNLDNMYMDGKKFKKALDKILLVLLKMNLQPMKERERRSRMGGQQDNKIAPVVGGLITRNKKRSLLNKYQKQLMKHELRQQASKVEKMIRKINYIKSIKTERLPTKPKKSYKYIGEKPSTDIEQVNKIGDEVNISHQRLRRIKGILKWQLYTQTEKSTFSRESIGIKDISDKEMLVCEKLYYFLSPYIPRKEERNWISAQVPFLVLANTVFGASNYKKLKVKLCPRPRPSSLLCLPVDAAMLYTLMSSFGDTNYSLICKDRFSISSLPIALKKKADVFGSIFDLTYIQNLCKSRKLEFVHRIIVRPGLVTCIINGGRTCRKVQEEPHKARESIRKQGQETKIIELEEEAADLNKQLQEKEKNFKLQNIDRDIKNCKRARNLMSDSEQREAAASQIKKMKHKRWNEFRSIEMLRLDLKDIRRKAHLIRTGRNVDNDKTTDTDINVLHDLRRMKYSGTDYGLKTMSVTVGISPEMFNAHLNFYNNKFYPKNPLPVKQDSDPPFFPLPKAHKLTSKDINYLCLKNKMSNRLEQRKKKTELGKNVSEVELNLSKLSNKASSTVIDEKEYFVYNMKEREVLRTFYYSPTMCREKRTVELRTIRTKDRVAAKERRFVKGESKETIPIMAIGNAGTGVGSNIKGYDRRGGKWLEKLHSRYVQTVITDEYMTSQLCLYCYFPITHPRTSDNTKILGTSRCLNPDCPAFKHGRATNNRDVMSAAAIGISAMTKLLCKQNFPPFSKTY